MNQPIINKQKYKDEYEKIKSILQEFYKCKNHSWYLELGGYYLSSEYPYRCSYLNIKNFVCDIDEQRRKCCELMDVKEEQVIKGFFNRRIEIERYVSRCKCANFINNAKIHDYVDELEERVEELEKILKL